jgi:hypothetical protein
MGYPAPDAPTSGVAGDDTGDRAQLHPRIVATEAGWVYSPGVLHLRDEAAARWTTLNETRNTAGTRFVHR